MMKTLYEMEMILVDLVGTPGMDFSIENIEKNYGTGSNKEGAPFGQELAKNAIQLQMRHIRDEWIKLQIDRRTDTSQWKKDHPNDKYPLCAQDVIDMMKESFAESKSVDNWNFDAPLVMKLLSIMAAIAATSAVAERTFSLARHLKTFTRAHMGDKNFRTLGILAWYDDQEVQKIVDFVKIGNEFISVNAERKQMMGLRFTEDDFTPKQFDSKR